ncbi:YigZ family protein [Ihubacter sp. mB4P-1]|uniref:YigZ family protein n=1 Tax=Ihubacter sp. mB4P-1 TaxID=3242370 RepID=UPI003C79F79E
MKLYSTVAKEGWAEQSIERSRFIAYVSPAETREEAEAFIASVRKKHKDATHNVPAMVIGDKFQLQWASDDGEPQGTSGAPMVQMLVHEGITNVCIVVTRYFGGVKLGTGGLVRAYTSSAKLGLAEAGICDVVEMQTITYQVDYAVFNKIQNFPFTFAVNFDNIIYADTVAFDVITDPSDAGALRDTVTGLSGGKAIIISEEISPQKIER